MCVDVHAYTNASVPTSAQTHVHMHLHMLALLDVDVHVELIYPKNTLGKGYLVMVAYAYTNRRIRK